MMSSSKNKQKQDLEDSSISLSIVSTLFNESENIEQLLLRVTATANKLYPEQWEYIVVDNGSNDSTATLLRSACSRESRIKLVQLTRNFGYQGGILAGLHHARGEWIYICDGDLQDPPEMLSSFMEKAHEGYDVVYGVRKNRKEKIFKRCCYWIFYRLWALMTQINMPLDAGDFGVCSRRVLDTMLKLPERLIFLRGLRSWCGFRQIGVEYERDARYAGDSKFKFLDMIRLAIDGWTSFSVVPLQLIGSLGFILCGLSIAIITLVIIQWALSALHILPILIPVPGLTQISVLITFFCGLQMLTLGVIGEYLGRVYLEVKRRPRYIVACSINLESESDYL